MTVFALRTVIALVGIVVLVATVTIARRLFDGVVRAMTGLAGGLRMASDQWKTGAVVIEGDLLPRNCCVTARAVRASTSPVNVIGSVARVASLRQARPLLTLVTAHAGRFGVRPGQGVAGLCMVEGLDGFPSGNLMAVLTPTA